MKSRRHTLAFILALVTSACGDEELKLHPRQKWNTEQIVQKYEARVFYSASGFAYYVARAMLEAEPQYGSKSMKLPTGDLLVFNGLALTWSDLHQDYRATGTVMPSTFSFAWTHEGQTYANAIGPAVYPPVSMPSTVSKSQGLMLSIPGLPEATQATASLNEGVVVQGPFHALPVEVDGAIEGTGSDLSKLNAGPGVLTLLETTVNDLQAKTVAGGTITLHVQYGWNVAIEE